MATNKSMIQLLERLADLIDEVNAIKKVMKRHIGQQKRQFPKSWGDRYVYNKKKKEYVRDYR